MKKLFALVVIGLAVFAVAVYALSGRKVQPKPEAEGVKAAEPTLTNDERVPVVVELFTSEGCSSCPPADALLARLEKEQPVAGAEVIALAQHVDYWNYLGWADPFSSPEFSARQGEYARAFGKDGVYTPQMVVDGRAEFPGGNSRLAFDAISKAAGTPKAEVQLARAREQGAQAGDTLRLAVRVNKLPRLSGGDTADVLLAVTEDDLATDVRRGENSGRKLNHVGVVRRLLTVGSVASDAGTFTAERSVPLEKGWRREHLRAVVFVQERAGKRIVGAASLKPFG